ncbi:hypothetical protein JCM6882_006077 [Rhodosporidiobolus microsporus]
MSSDAPKGRGRGRGRRAGGVTLSGASIAAAANAPSPSPAPESREATATPAPEAVDDAPSEAESRSKSSTPAAGGGGTPGPSAPKPAVKRVASVGVGSTRASSVGLSRTPSIGAGAGGAAGGTAGRDRPVGGLLGSTSEFRPGAAGAGGKAKFRPNMKRGTQRAVEDDEDEDVKMEDGDNWRNKRGPRGPPRQRQELEMTASGPMAQGPGGPPRAWGAKPAAGASGAAVMAASRAGTLNRMLDDDSDASDLEVDADPFDEEGGVRFKAVDLNDIGLSAVGANGEEEGVAPLVLPRDPKVTRTKIKRLKERKVERMKKEAREQAKREGIVKTEDGMSIDDATPGPSTASGSPAGSKAGTPALDSKESSIMGVDEEKEAKDLKDLEEEEKKEIILSEAFEVAPEARGELYMFQFPRKFPALVPSPDGSSASTSLSDLSLADAVKADPDAPPARRKPTPPEWGRFGTRQEKAARWSEEAGRIGELCVHRSGKVTLKINGDLRYEILPAAQPSFLQEIAVLDHPAPKSSSSDSKGKSKRSSSSSSGSDSSSGSSSDSGSDSDASSSSSDKKQKRKTSKRSSKAGDKKARAPPPPDSLVILGQTSKKFLVVPEVADLLEKVGAQEKQERDEERRVKMAKAGLAGGGAAGAVKKEGGRR